jgi:photosystem II stability/assembly factor-like uncharacterized protein
MIEMKKNYIFTALLLTSLNSVFGQWTSTGCPAPFTTAYDIAVSGDKLLVAKDQGVYRTSDGTTWTEEVNGISEFMGYSFAKSLKNFGGTLYLGTYATDLYTSTDDGSNWVTLPGKSGLGSAKVTSIFKNNSVLIYGTDNGSGSTYYSTDNGSTWNTSQFDYGSGLQQGFESVQYDIVELDGNLYMSTLKDFFKSTDNGATWILQTTAPAIPDGGTTSLTVINGGLLLAISGNGVHRTMDGGATWTKVLGGATGALDNNITRVYYENGVALAGGGLGIVYLSEDNGATWTDITETGIATAYVLSFKIWNGKIYAGTMYDVYSRPYTSTASLKTLENEVISISIFPNPASSIINVEANISSSYQIVNLLGHVVQEGTLNQGQNKLNIENIAKGNYLLKVENEVKQISIN